MKTGRKKATTYVTMLMRTWNRMMRTRARFRRVTCRPVRIWARRFEAGIRCTAGSRNVAATPRARRPGPECPRGGRRGGGGAEGGPAGGRENREHRGATDDLRIPVLLARLRERVEQECGRG